MFSFMGQSGARRKKITDKEDKDLSVVAPGTEITYKKTLISKYHDEHESLRQLFGMALTTYQQANDEVFLSHLHDLQIALRRHLLDEELNLYVYLRHCYSHDKKKLEFIARFKKNSKKNSVEILSYIKQFTEEGKKIVKDEPFILRFLKIGNMLEILFAAEEQHLYPVYKMPEMPEALLSEE